MAPSSTHRSPARACTPWTLNHSKQPAATSMMVLLEGVEHGTIHIILPVSRKYRLIMTLIQKFVRKPCCTFSQSPYLLGATHMIHTHTYYLHGNHRANNPWCTKLRLLCLHNVMPGTEKSECQQPWGREPLQIPASAKSCVLMLHCHCEV